MIELAVTLLVAAATHTVQPGETLAEIGAETGYSWYELYERNELIIGVDPDRIRPGMVLFLPHDHNVSAGFSDSTGTVVVMPGQTLSELAAIFGTTSRELYAANRDQISDPNIIHPGMVLALPA